jgi:hypothetical protein
LRFLNYVPVLRATLLVVQILDATQLSLVLLYHYRYFIING